MNDYFCVLPFFGAEYTPSGFTTPCCLLPKDTNIKQLQTEMLAGQRSVACQKCWTLEDQNKISDRQLKNSAFDFYKNQAIEFVEEDCRKGDYSAQIVKLYTSNLCNSTCVTCGPGASTAWATLKNIKVLSTIAQPIIDSFNYKDFIMVNFVGGEPLKEKKNFDILLKLIAVGNTACFISMTTNGSVQLSTKQKDILREFKNLNICLSIDGIEKRFEYMRFPLKWDVLLENIRFFKENNIQLSVSYTISNLNVMYYQETVDWFNLQGLDQNHILVSYPEYFSPMALPKEVKNILNNPIVSIDNHSSIDDENFIAACIEIKNQDTLKNIKIKDYLPEFYELIPTSLR
jgi:sulfatase maturation enzyme AslB (radical SAM superfamily)